MQHKERWKRIAAKARTPLSKFIIFSVDGVIDEDEEFQPQRGIPSEIKVVALTPIGFPSEDDGLFSKAIKTMVGSNKRKPIEEIMHSEKW